MGWKPDRDPYGPCPCKSGKKYKFCCLAKDREADQRESSVVRVGPGEDDEGADDLYDEDAGAPDPGPLPYDMRSMERVLAGIANEGEGDTPRARAQERIYDAWETRDGKERVRLAREALAIDADCADAYNILAEEEAKSADEALDLYRKATEAAERTFGPDYFKEHEGHFYGILETRPYMRARRAIAEILFHRGFAGEAAAHFRDLLKLNPNDNQANREMLAACLIDLGRWDELAGLLDRFKQDGLCWAAYSRAILAFVRSGPDGEARRLLKKARDANPHVPEFLSGRRQLPRAVPPHYSPGDANEAVIFAAVFARPLEHHATVLSWLTL
jgi:tetratricopeptide (TPR) repeat protein